MNGRNHHQCSRKFKWAGGKTILEAPARTGTAFGFEGNDEETASSFGRSSHAGTDRKTLDLADQTIGPSCGRWRVPGERQSDASDGTIMIHRLHDERYQRWRNAPTSVGRKEPSSCPTKSGTRISDSSSMFWESNTGFLRLTLRQHRADNHRFTQITRAGWPLADIGAVRIITEWRGR